jgi:DNA-directed RNA polymerase specialized sigma subunit
MTSAGSGRPAAAIAPGSELGGLDGGELVAIARSAPQASGRAATARELLVIRHRGLVAACVARHRRSPEQAEDLMQVGYVGLMKAISRFDPAHGGTLAAYAHPTIIGELRRHFRDRRWPVHVPRPARELMLASARPPRT